MKKMYYVALATLVAAFSCAKEANLEKEQAPVQGHAVTLGVDIPATKIDYSNTGSAIHPVWEAGDQIEVVYGSTSEIFTLSTGEGTQSATFTNGSSTLTEGTEYAVYYPAKDYDWSVQDGTLAHLPNYLVKTGLNSLTASINLEPQLTYFVLDLNNGEAKDLSLENAFFYNATAPFVVDSEAHTGEIKITPAAPFSYTAGVSTNAQIYVAVKTAGSTTGNTLGIDMQNGDHYAGVEGYSLTWDAGKDYAAANAYTKTSSASDLKYKDGLVGKSDNSTAFWSAGSWSDAIAIAPGKVLHLEFVNKGDGAESYHNWNLALSNTALGGTPYYEYFILRADNYGWCGNADNAFFKMHNLDFNVKGINTQVNGSTTFNWSDFKSILNGASVTMEIDHTTAGSVFVSVIAINGSNVITTTYNQAVSGSEDIVAFLAVDHSNVQITSVSMHDSSKTLTALSTTPCFVYEDDLPLATIFSSGAIQHQLVAHYSDLTTANADPAMLTSYGAAVLDADGAASQEFTVTFAGKNQTLTIPVIQGTGKLGSASLEGYAWVSNGTLAASSKVTAYMYLYAHNESWGAETFTNWEGPRIRFISAPTSVNCAARMDHWVDDAPAGITSTSNWIWDIFRPSITRSKVTLQAENDGANQGIARFAIQYASDNTVAGQGQHFQNHKNITIDSSDLVTEWNIWNCYAVYVDETTATANGWPTVTE